MNTPSPLVPQGSLPAKPKGKTNFRIAVFTVLAIHAVLLIGLLMQGCKPKREETAANVPKTNEFDFPPVTSLTNAGVYYQTNPVPDTNAGTNLISSLPAVTPTNVLEPVPPFPEPAPAPATPQSEYTVLRGDSFARIAKIHGVTVNAIQEANPGVDSRRLKVGQKISVPAGAARPAPNGTAQNGAARSTTTYVVKPGDTLTRIAKKHGVTLSVLRAENNLRTDQIKVGQKIKVPARLPAMKPTETAAAPATLPALSAPTNTATP